MYATNLQDIAIDLLYVAFCAMASCVSGSHLHSMQFTFPKDDELSYALGKQGGTRKKWRAQGEVSGWGRVPFPSARLSMFSVI